MKIRSLLLAVCLLSTGRGLLDAAPSTVVAGRPVLWSLHFDVERLRTGPAQELFARLDPFLSSLSGGDAAVPSGRLETFSICGFQPPMGQPSPVSFVADLSFSAASGGIAQRFQAIARKRNLTIEDVAGYPTLHFDHEGREVWIAKLNDTRVLVGTSRDLLQTLLTGGPDALATTLPTRTDEVLGGDVEVETLLTANPNLRNSELLKLLPHLDFHVLSAGDALDVNASAVLDSDRSARRAARMIDGMVAALAMRDPHGVPWDERLVLEQNGARLDMRLHLDSAEAHKLFDSFANEIADGVKSVQAAHQRGK
jgi:hypothetical protein